MCPRRECIFRHNFCNDRRMERDMRSKFLSLLLVSVAAVCLCFGLAACDNGSDEDSDGKEHQHNPVLYGATEPTCTKDGHLRYYFCHACQKFFLDEACTEEVTRSEIVKPAKGHTADSAWEADDTGHFHLCKDCGTKLTETVAEHSFGTQWTKDNKSHWHECEVCGAKQDEERHSFQNMLCEICNTAQSESEGLWYELNTSGDGYIVTGLGFCDDTDVLIPSMHDGLPVTEIESLSFGSIDPKVKSIIIPDSVTEIGGRAFHGLYALKEVKIGKGVAHFSDPSEWDTIPYVFFSCKALERVIVDEENAVYSSVSGILYSKDKSKLLYVPNAIREVTLPDETTVIGREAFRESSITTFTIPKQITEIGDFAFFDCTGLKSLIWDAEDCRIGSFSTSANIIFPNVPLTELIIGEDVRSIPEGAFSGLDMLETVTIPVGVTHMGGSVFYGCSGLESVIWNARDCTMSGGDFFRGTKIKTVTFGEEVGVVPSRLLLDCAYLTEVVLPDSISKIGEVAFGNCYELKKVTIGRGVTEIEDLAFYGCYKLIEAWNYSGLTLNEGSAGYGYVAYYAKRVYTKETLSKQTVKDGYLFYEDEDEACLLGYVGESTELALPTTSPGGKSDYKIWDYALYSHDELTSLTIGSSVTSIGTFAFYDCRMVTGELQIPDSVTEMGDYAFGCCSGLTSVTIGSRVTKIGHYAFEGCSGLERVNITGLAAWCKIDFANLEANPLYFAHHLYLDNAEVKNLTIPAEITEIKKFAFCGCSGLESVTIGDGVTEIGFEAFQNCSGLESVTIGSGVTAIARAAFLDCSGLESVTFINPNGWYVDTSSSETSGTDIPSESLQDATTAATYLKETYYDYDWKRNV